VQIETAEDGIGVIVGYVAKPLAATNRGEEFNAR
jgi:hypothetical protein